MIKNPKSLVNYFLFLFILTACKKDQQANPTEAIYKSKFETLLKIQPGSNSDNKTSRNSKIKIIHFSFKEAN
ncbi:hypothetical protein SAMN05518672_1011331 [Chitinophaga sp. CF118]|nr:hypothetical protein SAMN05518672_1011331 [Chitinophaga sp. CF118]